MPIIQEANLGIRNWEPPRISTHYTPAQAMLAPSAGILKDRPDADWNIHSAAVPLINADSIVAIRRYHNFAPFLRLKSGSISEIGISRQLIAWVSPAGLRTISGEMKV